jgi:hypothetical protein
MPVLHFTNSTPDSLNLGAFLSGLPSQYQNELASGETWAHDFPTLPFSSFEARVDSGPANRFHPDSAAKDFGTMAGAVGKGAASVLKGAGGLAGAGPTGFAGLGGTANVMQEASDLMNAASAGASCMMMTCRAVLTSPKQMVRRSGKMQKVCASGWRLSTSAGRRRSTRCARRRTATLSCTTTTKVGYSERGRERWA